VIELRAHQTAALSAIEVALAAPGASTLLESATGTGKTTIFAEFIRRVLAADPRARVLAIAHRRELVDQAAARLRVFGIQVGIERGRQWSKGERAVVASVQTLASQGGARLASFPVDEFKYIIVDEAHHAAAVGYRAILDHFHTAKVLGVTATPDRADGVALGEVFDTCAFRYGIADAVKDGQLVPARGLRVEVPGLDLSKVRQKTIGADGRPLKTPAEGWTTPPAPGESRDLHPGDLGAAALAPEAVEGVTGPLVALAEGRKTVVFAVNRAHARALVESLRARGATADFVEGVMKAGDRAEVLRKHRAGEIQFLVNCMILTEGYDDPSIKCVAMARPTQSRTLYAQACGRALRTHPGKTEALIIDFVGVSCQFDLVGPDDVLAGAMIEPTQVVNGARKSAPVAPPVVYTPPRAWPVRFVARVVTLVKKGARKAGGWLRRVLFG
jgi:superfamily II DNA or RNA helicase